MHSSAGSFPSETTSHSNRTSISTPPPQSRTSSSPQANPSTPNSPARNTNNPNDDGWSTPAGQSDTIECVDFELGSISLREGAGLVGLGFDDEPPVPRISLGSLHHSSAIENMSFSDSSSPSVTAVPSPAASVSPTPTAFATPSASPLPSSAYFDSSASNSSAALAFPSPVSPPRPENMNVASSPLSSSSNSTPSSCASPTFTTVASATVSPAAKFVISPAVGSPSHAITLSGSPSNNLNVVAAENASPSTAFASSPIVLPSRVDQRVASGSLIPGPAAVVSPDSGREGNEVGNGVTENASASTQTCPANRNCPSSIEVTSSSVRGRGLADSIHNPGNSAPAPSASANAEFFSFNAATNPDAYLISNDNLIQAHDTASSLSSAASSTDAHAQTFRTPNVYINGLPPNFPEEQLYNMTREFGGVISVRTFTRHVSERPTGYGFVLFETVDNAERCIEALRKYRNLHPSFSKQIHKIPGTAYATADVSQSSGMSSSGSSATANGAEDNTFKVKMEKLKDESSTNLYVEGLPLSIDEATLVALVSPYVIKSSRFFQTKLSHPPRIIAFVRLESRAACEEIIERLHGRMVRGWNDPGCRISVRFADSNEQRELRKKERSHREDTDSSPNRITMAQAALLNLRGSEINSRGASRSVSCPTGSFPVSPTEQSGLGSLGGMPQHPLTAQYQQQREMQLLLETLQAGGIGMGGGVNEGVGLGEGLHGNGMAMGAAGYHAQTLGIGHPRSSLPLSLPGAVDMNGMLSPHDVSMMRGWDGVTTSTHAGPGGFTPAEQLLLQAHAQARTRLGGQGQGLLGVGLPSSASTGAFSALPRSNMGLGVGRGQQQYGDHLEYSTGQQGYPPNLGMTTSSYSQFSAPAVDLLPAMSEGDFHATSQAMRQQQRSQVQPRARGAYQLQNAEDERRFHDGALSHNRAGSDAPLDLDLDTLRYREREMDRGHGTSAIDFASKRQQTHQAQSQQAQGRPQPSSLHMRATTLPASHFGNHRSVNGYESSKNGNTQSTTSTNAKNNHIRGSTGLQIDSVVAAGGSAANNEGDKDQSPLVSPALTYASRTPSSSFNSPATPYFAASGFEGYEQVGVNVGGGEHGSAGLGLGMMSVGGKGKGRAVSHS